MSRINTIALATATLASSVVLAGALSWQSLAFAAEKGPPVSCTSGAAELLHDDGTSGQLDEVVRSVGCHATEGTDCDWKTTIAQDRMLGTQRRLLEVNVREQRIRVIEVINGSLEPDGSRRKFHLGAMAGGTPAEVVAASYGIAPAHYREAVRS